MHDIHVESDLLASNQSVALENRAWFREAGLYVFNLMSAPGAGKTSLVERTIDSLKSEYRIGVIEGDIQSSFDADRITAHGVSAIQINTGGACHLDARQVHKAAHHLDLANLEVLIIENVGNLVCPAEFDLGEHDKIMMLSVTEGHDKPKKYPLMFLEARLLLINKMDMIGLTDFDMNAAMKAARDLNVDLDIIPVSCRTQSGLNLWYDWLKTRIKKVKNL